MAILIDIWGFVFTLIGVILLTTLALRYYWRRRLNILSQVHNRQHQTEIRDMIREFKHQASQCLRPIKDNLHLLKKEMQTPESAAVVDASALQRTLRDSLQDIEKYEWRLTRLIENMASVARLDAPDFSLRFSDVKLDVIVSDVVSEFQDAASAKEVSLTWWARPEQFPRLAANDESLRQVFINLIDNAIKYCGPGDEVDVSLEANKDKNLIVARISDTGVGIPAEDLKRIFGKGYTVEEARGRRPREGSQGLGLYIAWLVIQKHQGAIVAASQPGQGSTFTITLPIQRS